MTSSRPSRSLGRSSRTSTAQSALRGVALVHLVEVAREEVRLLAALGPADLDETARPAFGSSGTQQLLEARLERDGPTPRSARGPPRARRAPRPPRRRAARRPRSTSARAASSSRQVPTRSLSCAVAPRELAETARGHAATSGADSAVGRRVELRRRARRASRRACPSLARAPRISSWRRGTCPWRRSDAGSARRGHRCPRASACR